MKNFKYFVLTAVLLSSMLAGCDASWNPFRKKPVVADPPLATNLGTLDNTGAGTDTIRPDATGTAIGTNTAVVTTAAEATPVPPAPTAGTTYTIKKKDTLWSIATTHLGSGKRWPEIVSANPGLNPKKLAVGQTIKIPPK